MDLFYKSEQVMEEIYYNNRMSNSNKFDNPNQFSLHISFSMTHGRLGKILVLIQPF
jgi:hypothetical protein